MENNRSNAIDFLQLIVAGEIDKAYEKYVSEDFIHHNPYFAGDRESLKQAMKQNDNANPNKSLEVKIAISEDDKVMVYSHLKQNDDDLGAAVVHICRFHEGKIVEMWDVGQPVLEDSPNENGMF
ncbi:MULTISPECIES: ester cyclase [Sporosarcina]|uniref:Ester cyclase n=1 Tax=Sporosarcina contaminans TaxID=633403 RepID=A0ABW3U0V4_9BACL